VVSECSWFYFGTASRLEAGAIVRLSKSFDYLVDNLYRSILSAMKSGGQAESGFVEAPLPDSGMNGEAEAELPGKSVGPCGA
jgi:hypothetical protein